MMLYYRCLFFFFFQAEDGIRDKLVTGVQTCALPISGVHGWPRSLAEQRVPDRPRESERRCFSGRICEALEGARRYRASGPMDRSEERRVGKECRCRWWTYH